MTVEAVPPWTLGWRLRRALDYAGMSVEQMAAELDVSRSTLSRWMSDRGTPPRRLYLDAWARLTQVPAEWLRKGDQMAESVTGSTGDTTGSWFCSWDGVSERRARGLALSG